MKSFHSLGIIILLLSSHSNVFSQNFFVAGFIVTTQGDTLKGLVNSKDYGSTLKVVKYKAHADSEPRSFSAKNISAFYIEPYDELYFSRIASIDKKPIETAKLEKDDRNPKFVIDTVFLKQIARGKVNLYTYQDDIKKHFFIEKAGELKELLLIKYYYSPKNASVTSEVYKEQLKQVLLDCPSLNPYKVDLEEKPLIRLLRQYQECVGEKIVTESKKNSSNSFRFYILGSLLTSFAKYTGNDLYVSNLSSEQMKYKHRYTFAVGAGAEFSSKRKTNPFSFTFEAYWRKESYDTDPIQSSVVSLTEKREEIGFSTIQVSPSVKYTFNPQQASKFFIRLGLSEGFIISETNHMTVVRGIGSSNTLKIYDGKISDFDRTNLSIFAGAGVSLSRISLEARYENAKKASDTKAKFVTNILSLTACFKLFGQ
jgi:hypothetical protein